VKEHPNTRQRDVRTALHEAAMASVYAYISSDEGQSYIRSCLTRRRLGVFLDTDIEEAVLSEALRFLSRGEEITSAAAWCRRRINARTIDLSRGAIRKERVTGVRVDLNDANEGQVFDDAPALSEGLSLADVRQAVANADDTDANISAALTYVTRVADDASLHTKCPQPQSGSTRNEAAMWAGLWYSGADSCFGPGNATTKRRSRAMERVRVLLVTCAQAITPKGDSHE